MQNSIADFTRLKADLEALKGEKEGLEAIASFKQTFNIPDHVLSVKSLDDYKRNEEMNEETPFNPPRQITEAFIPHPAVQGGYLAEHNPASLEMLMEEMEAVKKKIKAMDAKEGQTEAMLRALKKLEDEIQNPAPRKDNLKRGKRAQASGLGARENTGDVRGRTVSWDVVGIDKPSPESAERKMRKRKVAEGRLGRASSDHKKLKAGDRVKILTKMFGKQYAQGREEYSYGQVVDVKGKNGECIVRRR
jgi:hypothetical protein